MDDMNKTITYRNAIRDTLWQYDGTPLEELFLRGYKQAKTRLTEAVSDNVKEGSRNGIYMWSVGLLTYGHLDVIPDILDNIPPRSAKVSRLANVVKVVLPIFELDKPADADEIAAWVEQNKDQLVWDKDELVFKLQGK